MKKDLQHLAPREAEELLVLAGIAVRARTQRETAKVVLSIEGDEVTPRAIRAGVHELLATRRSERGIDQVDLTGLAEYG